MNQTTTSFDITKPYCDKCKKKGMPQTHSHYTHQHEAWSKL